MDNRDHKPSVFTQNIYESVKDSQEVGAILDEEQMDLTALCLFPDGSPLISDEIPEDSIGLS